MLRALVGVLLCLSVLALSLDRYAAKLVQDTKAARSERSFLSNTVLANGTFSVFSALHDPVAGEVRVFAEVFPDTVCNSVAACQFRVKGTTKETVRVNAVVEVPFAALSEKPQLRECFIVCHLPGPGYALDDITIEDKAGHDVITWPVEEVEALSAGEEKGVGMCVGPIFSETPTLLDWLQYYADLGVAGIHMYASVAEFILGRNDYMHLPGSHRSVQFQAHHLVTWRAFHPSRWSQHYYGQWLIFNDCIFRTRNIYEFIMFHDRDEFVHFVGTDNPREVKLTEFFRRQFGSDKVASVTYWGGLYRIHCHVTRVGFVGTTPAHFVSTVDYQSYQGYDVWAHDARTPDFTGCTLKTCHPKSVVRPEAVDIMSVHHLGRVRHGFEPQPKLLPPETIFIKHLRCLTKPSSSEWEPDLDKPLCSDEDVLEPDPKFGGVPVCPEDIVQAARERNRTAQEPA